MWGVVVDEAINLRHSPIAPACPADDPAYEREEHYKKCDGAECLKVLPLHGAAFFGVRAAA